MVSLPPPPPPSPPVLLCPDEPLENRVEVLLDKVDSFDQLLNVINANSARMEISPYTSSQELLHCLSELQCFEDNNQPSTPGVPIASDDNPIIEKDVTTGEEAAPTIDFDETIISSLAGGFNDEKSSSTECNQNTDYSDILTEENEVVVTDEITECSDDDFLKELIYGKNGNTKPQFSSDESAFSVNSSVCYVADKSAGHPTVTTSIGDYQNYYYDADKSARRHSTVTTSINDCFNADPQDCYATDKSPGHLPVTASRDDSLSELKALLDEIGNDIPFDMFQNKRNPVPTLLSSAPACSEGIPSIEDTTTTAMSDDEMFLTNFFLNRPNNNDVSSVIESNSSSTAIVESQSTKLIAIDSIMTHKNDSSDARFEENRNHRIYEAISSNNGTYESAGCIDKLLADDLNAGSVVAVKNGNTFACSKSIETPRRIDGNPPIADIAAEVEIPFCCEEEVAVNESTAVCDVENPIQPIATKSVTITFYCCDKCDLLFSTKESLEYHKSNSHANAVVVVVEEQASMNEGDGDDACQVIPLSEQDAAAADNNDDNNNNVVRGDDREQNVVVACNLCTKKQSISRDKFQQRKLDVEKSYRCDLCLRRYGGVSSTTLRLKPHHHSSARHCPVGGQQFYYCNYCKKWFDSKNELDIHAKLHTPARCARCNKLLIEGRNYSRLISSSSSPSSSVPASGNCDHCETLLLNERRRKKHACERWYKCSRCNKRFNNASNHNRHIRTHQDESKFKDAGLNSSKFSRDDANGHRKIRSKNVEAAGKRYSCNVCHHSFNHQVNLKLHKMSHINSELYCCNYCRDWFGSLQLLTKHLNSHSEFSKKGC